MAAGLLLVPGLWASGCSSTKLAGATTAPTPQAKVSKVTAPTTLGVGGAMPTAFGTDMSQMGSFGATAPKVAAPPMILVDAGAEQSLSTATMAEIEAEGDLSAIIDAAEADDPDAILAEIDEQLAAEAMFFDAEADGELGSGQSAHTGSGSGVMYAGQGPGEMGASLNDAEQVVEAALLSAYDVEYGGVAQGVPNQGRISSAVPLPENPHLYTIRSKAASFGTSHTMLQIVAAFTEFRDRTGYEGRILIGDISRKDGGKIRSHASHQAGRDIDILMPRLPESRGWGHKVDWDMVWELVASFLRTGEVEHIFLDYDLQKNLHAAAKRSGVSDSELAELIQWPSGARSAGVIRNSPGHWAHVHVRISCGPSEPKCRSYGQRKRS